MNGDLLCRYKLTANSNANFLSYAGSRKPATPGRETKKCTLVALKTVPREIWTLEQNRG